MYTKREKRYKVSYSSLFHTEAPASDSGGYSNYTKGIADPDFWFEPPSFCPPPSAKVSTKQ